MAVSKCWTRSLKRTRSGALYSKTSFQMSLGRKAKQRKVFQDGGAPSTTRSIIEEMPTEILQTIFFACMNGNLLKASPRIAVKLSGSDSVYRATLVLALYSHQVPEICDAMGYQYLLSGVGTCPLITAWETRSMTKAVLGSRWCSWGFVQQFLFALLAKACVSFRTVAVRDLDPSIIKMCDSILSGSYEVNFSSLFGRAFHGTAANGDLYELGTSPYSIALAYCPPEALLTNYDEDGDLWEDIKIFQYQVRFLGIPQIDDEGGPVICSRKTPFAQVFREVVGLGGMEAPRPFRDIYQNIDWQLTNSIRHGEHDRLRHYLAVQYFLYPEDQPFTLPASLYRDAARYDIEVEFRSDYPEYYLPVLHVLFEVDPSSLPSKDPVLVQWAVKARSRVRRRDRHQRLNRIEMRALKHRRGGYLKRKDLEKARLEHSHVEYINALDIEILRYMKTGILYRAVDSFSPNLSAPKYYDEEVDIDEDDYTAGIFEEIDEDYWSDDEEVPDPDPLDFLCYGDYDKTLVEYEMNSGDIVETRYLSENDNQPDDLIEEDFARTDVGGLLIVLDRANDWWDELSSIERLSKYTWFTKPIKDEMIGLASLLAHIPV